MGVEYEGYISHDTIRLGSLATNSLPFMAYYYTRPIGRGGIKRGFDGILGLGSSYNDDITEHHPEAFPSYLDTLKARKLFDANVMAFKFPQHRLGDVGELMLGGTNPDLYEGSFKTVQVAQNAEIARNFPFSYILPVASITLNKLYPIKYVLRGSNALLSSIPRSYLPSYIVHDILNTIGAKEHGGWHSVPCDRRSELPGITFEIGGHEITISALDYIFEMEAGEGMGKVCVVGFDSLGEDSENNGWLILGSTFLRGWYTRFDLDKREIGCKYHLKETWHGS